MRQPPADDHYRRARYAMVAQQIAARGVLDEIVLEAMRAVPRHRFVQPIDEADAYGDFPLPIGYEQTISQPYMVARMVELCALFCEEIVLEVGAGSGYQTAVLAQVCNRVFATEIIPELAYRATKTLRAIGETRAVVKHHDGSQGLEAHAPYDAIVVAAGAPSVPAPLLEQLKEGGRLVIPVGPNRGLQVLQCYHRRGDLFDCKNDTACRFVDLQGQHGWTA